MQKNDIIIKGIDEQKQIRIWAATTMDLVREAQTRHQATPMAAAALGKVLTAAVMMASDLKGKEDILTLRVDGGGAAGSIIATANCMGQVRGFIKNPDINIPFIPNKPVKTGNIIGKHGLFEVSKDLGLRQSFNGRVALVNGEIDEDLTNYLQYSEQITAIVKMEVLIGVNLEIMTSGGVMIQAMPQCEGKTMAQVKKNLAGIPSLGTMLKDDAGLEEVIAILMKGRKYGIVSREKLEFQCNCSAERLIRIISGLPKDELAYLCGDQDTIEVSCNFCNRKYLLSREEIQA